MPFLALAFASAIAVGSSFECRVMTVHDGDTWTCEDGRKVRMWGVNAPERNAERGPAATRWLAEKIAGQDLECTARGFNPATKRYRERTVGQCRLKREDLGCALIESGLGKEAAKFSKGAYAGCEPP